MGKLKQRRIKSHFPAPQPEGSKKDSAVDTSSTNTSVTHLPVYSKENVFEGLMIADLFKDVPKNDDTVSMKSYISNKSIKGEKAITKKEKLKLRREMFLKKFDTVNQCKKYNKIRNKKIGEDTKVFYGNLLSTELTDKPELKQNKIPKKKAIQKRNTMQRNINKNISFYKKLLKNSSLEKNPFEAISSHIKAVVEEERTKLKSK